MCAWYGWQRVGAEMETAFLLRLLNAQAACEAWKRETVVSADSPVRSEVQRKRHGWVCSLSAAGFSSQFCREHFLGSVPTGFSSVDVCQHGR